MLRKIQINSNLVIQTFSSGRGRSVIFIHGLGGSLSFWAKQVRELSESFQILRYDLRGHGNSSPSIHQNIVNHVEDLLFILDELNIDQADIIGLSMGGMIAQVFAAHFPNRVRNLVLVSTTSVFPSKGRHSLLNLAILAQKKGMEAVAQNFAPLLFANSTNIDDPNCKKLADAFSNQDVKSFCAAARILAEADTTSELGRISARTLLCFGEKDKQTPPFLGERLAEYIPQSKLQIFFNAGHVLPVEAPVQFNKSLLSFLENLDVH